MTQVRPNEKEKAELEESYDENCRRAAEAISKADFFLFATGAGWSADSGLSVYKDIANVEAWKNRGLEYSHLCDPEWLETEPEVFYGFWGSCFNDYRRVAPHEGYTIVKKWRDRFFADPKFQLQNAEKIEETIQKNEASQSTLFTKKEITDLPGPFFVYTSNVDAHFLTANFKRPEVYEIHGNVETWHCMKKCQEIIWPAPSDFKFEIDKEMNAVKPGPDASPLENTGFGSNFPVCPHCGGLARPGVVMFSDSMFLLDPVPEKIYVDWIATVEDLIKEYPEKKLVIVEIGCGDRVPSVRYEVEEVHEGLDDNVTTIRINPEFPLADDVTNGVFIPIMSRGLAAVQKIDSYLEQM
eukprot:TRINITY_DN1163_c0_g2_i1.p1 TRINITY_DN1163_c0_g2~~TRINITY_DN1163_c0_g2_i1.p1  ORF type:complete len:354 (-),score=70.11 TRINITY_DN1163_c0_g2_i1:51-1112(-)